jgi:hypothetical protein
MNNAQVSLSFTARYNALCAHRLAPAQKGADASKDIEAVISTNKSSVFQFTAAVNEAIDRMGIDTTQIFATDRNPKVIKRFIQFVHAIIALDYKQIDNTTATIIYALQIAGDNPLTTDALHYIGAGLKAGRISPETRGVSRLAANKLFGRVGLSTIPTQASRTVGKNGFLQLAGATTGEPGKQNQAVKLNKSHPLILAFDACMSKASAANIDEMVKD